MLLNLLNIVNSLDVKTIFLFSDSFRISACNYSKSIKFLRYIEYISNCDHSFLNWGDSNPRSTKSKLICFKKQVLN